MRPPASRVPVPDDPPRRVWITRSPPGARATAAAVRALGRRAVVSPLIGVRVLPFPPPRWPEVAALAFTSAAGVRAFAASDPRRDRPVFAVGAATAAAVRAAGFAEVRDADGAAHDLAALIVAEALGGSVLVPGAREPAFDLPAALAAAGVSATAVAVYETAAAPPPRRALRLLAAGRLGAVLLQSASAARALDAASPPAPAAGPPLLLALSAACLPRTLSWPARVAAAPRERDLLALLPPLDRPAPAR